MAGLPGRVHRCPDPRQGRAWPDDAPEHHEEHVVVLRHHAQEDQLQGAETIPNHGSRDRRRSGESNFQCCQHYQDI